MLVYGDPRFCCSISEAIGMLSQTTKTAGLGNFELLRRLLIRSGQLEQGLADANETTHSYTALLDSVEWLTDFIAGLFCDAFHTPLSAPGLEQVHAQLRTLHIPSGKITIKVPEGFQFYTLYPEQFIVATREWIKNAPAERGEVLVVGIRSIGTSLSAIVLAELRRAGLRATRQTVRPTGHPFGRTLHGSINTAAESAIIVDEGPGLSGSSMVAVAEALVASGIPQEKITFFPGHAGLPGGAAAQSIQLWWRNTPRNFIPLATVRWNGENLEQHLILETERILKCPVSKWEGVSGGTWRSIAYKKESEWPPAFVPFERSKYKGAAENGTTLLWKFEGLGAWDGANFKEEMSNGSSPFAIEPVGISSGFTATPWFEGSRLTRQNAKQGRIPNLARHIAALAKPPLAHEEHNQAIERLVEMTFWNVKDVLGEKSAYRAILFQAPARNALSLPSYGDGHLAPWEWIQTVDGAIHKADSSGHDSDHTMVGRQSVLWDVAGALVEWNFSAEDELVFLHCLQQQEGVQVDRLALSFFRNAYCAFQVGKSVLSREIVGDPGEKQRLSQALEYYCNHLFLEPVC